MEQQAHDVVSNQLQKKVEIQSQLLEKEAKVDNVAESNHPQTQKKKEDQNPQLSQHQLNQVVQQQEQNHVEDDNESNWTDATQSIAPLDQDDIWVVDDDIVQAMQIDSGEEGQFQEDENQQKQEMSEGDEQEGKQNQKLKKENQIDLNELQQQFVKGNQSNQDWRLGKHQKFCTYVAVSQDGKNVFTGGGDDVMLCFRQDQGQWKQFYRLKHTETVNKIEISHDGKYVISSTQNQAYCTDISTLQPVKFQIEQPTDVVCHKQGGLAIVAHQYTVSIYNLKGLSLYTSYSLDLPPTIISFCDKGKQIVAACENKLRIITPKNGQIVKGNGQFHKQQISAMIVGNNVVYTGCIEGKLFASSLSKGTVISQLQPMKGTINLLSLTENNQYLLVAPQGEGVYWIDTIKLKKLFHNPRDISVTDIVQVHAPTVFAISDLSGKIHIVDRRSPMQIIKTFDAGNTIHKLSARGSQLYAACEDGYMRVFDVSK